MVEVVDAAAVSLERIHGVSKARSAPLHLGNPGDNSRQSSSVLQVNINVPCKSDNVLPLPVTSDVSARESEERAPWRVDAPCC